MIIFSCLVGLWGLTGIAQAAGGGDQKNLLANGAGISSPSMANAIEDNPAGLVYNNAVRIAGSIRSADSDFDAVSAGGRLLLGNGNVGGSIGLLTYHDRSDASRFQAEYGLGVYADMLHTALGVGITSRFQKDTMPGDDPHSVNFGAITNVGNGTRVAMAAYGGLRGPDFYGTGVTTDLSSDASFSLDASTDSKIEGTVVKPAIEAHAERVQATVGYGFRIKNRGSPTWIQEGLSFGMGLGIGQGISLQGMYNYHSKYYLALVARI